jgi:SAM-dependent methyltransferase
MQESSQKKIEDRASSLWGNDLHKKFHSAPSHCGQIIDIFPNEWQKSMHGHLLEIGCGSGADLNVFSQMDSFSKITAIDLGENIYDLKKQFSTIDRIELVQGNALNLDYHDNSFDAIYSFGIFHHTSSPLKCFKESYRVLKGGGSIFLYLYSSHEDILFKRLGVMLEKIIMKFFSFIPYTLQNIICFLLSPICWFLFSVPANVLYWFNKKNISKKIPFYFGTHPFSLIPDLKDRLMSPINHRFTKNEIELILKSENFNYFKVKKISSGLYIYAKK